MPWSWVERGIVQDGGGVLYSVGTTFQIGGARRSGLEILMPNHGKAAGKCSWSEMRACCILV